MSARTRRELLSEGATGALAVYGLPSMARHRPRRRARNRVAILGGGVAGLTAAHELGERGFDVTVYERRAFGGKARSFGVPHTASGGRRPLPGEHGARFIPGLYANLPDTMRRIPFPGSADGVYGNVVVANQDCYARSGGREDWNVSYAITDPHPWTLEQFRETLIASLDIATHIPPNEIAYFVDRLLVFFASCDARRFGEWEQTSWYDFTAAERFSEDYRRLLISSATRFVLGSKATEASARTLGLLWEAGTYTNLGRTGGAFDRVLDLPTNEAWIDPWLAQLRRLGVKLRLGAEVEQLTLRRGRIVSVRIRTGHRRRERVEADWFVLAVPVERARRLLDAPLRRADPALEGLDGLVTRWMNGIQFFLREPVPVVRGHVLYVDAPWALTSISQAQFWPARNFPRDYGDGSVRDCMSVDIAAFDAPGIVYGRAARDLAPAQIARECWEQMKAHLNDTGRTTLRDDQLLRWVLDPGLLYRRGHARPSNQDPLFISTPGAWSKRPDATSAIPNLFLAADYVKVSVDTACMEGANDAGRRATNALLAAADSHAAAATVYPLYAPPEWEPFRSADELAYSRGLPNALDVPVAPALP